MNKKPILLAIEAVANSLGKKWGAKTELARRVNRTPQEINNYIIRDGRIPAPNIKTVEAWVKATGLTKEELFPQFYGVSEDDTNNADS